MATGVAVRAMCLKVLTDLAGKPVHVDTLMERTNLSAVQIKAAMNHAVKDGLPIKVISTATVWQFAGTVEPLKDDEPDNRTGELWEVVGHTKSGMVMLRDEVGILYRATEME